jgi:hypothetical protein
MGEERRLTCSRRGGIDGREEEYPYGKQHENRSTRKEEQTMKLAIEKATPASRATR